MARSIGVNAAQPIGVTDSRRDSVTDRKPFESRIAKLAQSVCKRVPKSPRKPESYQCKAPVSSPHSARGDISYVTSGTTQNG